jgi:nucleoid-associated protein YgaU
MPTVPQRSTTRLRPAALVRGVLSLLALGAALGLVPVLLVAATQVLWANGHDELTHLLTRSDSGDAFLLVLLAVAWVAWAHFGVCVLVEIIAQLRGRVVRPRRGFAMSQRAAATLIGSIVVLLPTGSALAAPTSAVAVSARPVPGAAATDVGTHSTPQVHIGAAKAEGGSTAAAEQDYANYTVRDARPAESLWSIAERELGDGEKWRAIAEANEGRTMSDGAVFRADVFLQPGWDLLIPATRHTAGTGGAGHETRSVTVEQGQTLSAIAEDKLGEATRYPEIYAKNRGEAQPGGHHFTNPDLIYPSQRLDLPGQTEVPRDHPRTGADSTPHDKPEQDTPHTPDAAQKPSPPASDAPVESASPSGPPGAGPAPSPDRSTTSPRDGASSGKDADDEHNDHDAALPPLPAPSTTPSSPKPSPTTASPSAPATSAPDRDRAANSESGVTVWTLAGVGALLAASAAGTLGIKRILQQRRRRAGETIAMPEEPSRLEQALTTAAEPASVQLLDSALRTLHHRLQEAAVAGEALVLPALRGARVTARTVELLVEDTAAAPLAPFSTGSEGWWTLSESAELLDADAARHVPAPWPGLVTVGSDRDGNLLLLNFPHIRTLLLRGEAEGIREVARAIALEAATCVWIDQAEILTVGLGDELAPLLPQGRLRAVPDLRAAIRDLGELLLERHQAGSDEDAGAPLPWVLICATAVTTEESWDLADALAAARGLPIAVVLPADGASSCFPEAEVLDTAGPSLQPFPALNSEVELQHISHEDYRQFVVDLRTAEQPAQEAAGPWRNVPPGGAASASASGSVSALVSAPPAATPFASLTAAAGPAAIRLVSPASATVNSAESTGPEAEAPAAPNRSVVSLGKEPDADHHGPPEVAPADPDAPVVQVLGPVTVTGIQASGHGPKLAALAALVFFKPGRDAEALREAMDPNSPWSKPTLQSRMSELRTRLGTNAQGELYLPRDRTRGYRLISAVTSDWSRFQQLAGRGLALGPEGGLGDLEEALSLVRGRPFSGGPHAWAAPLLQEMVSRITDVSHTIATWRRTGPRPDLDAARRAVATGLDVDDTAELLYQDWMRIEDAADNRSGIYRAINTLQEINRRLDVSMEPDTEDVIQELLGSNRRAEGL